MSPTELASYARLGAQIAVMMQRAVEALQRGEMTDAERADLLTRREAIDNEHTQLLERAKANLVQEENLPPAV